jgi:hypothetical protein
VVAFRHKHDAWSGWSQCSVSACCCDLPWQAREVMRS